MAKPLDLIGQQFGRWTVLYRAPNNDRGSTMWHCVCVCGMERDVLGSSLIHGRSLSCGCLQKEIVKENKLKDITGQVFGHLTVIKHVGSDNNRKSLWQCQCDCDAKTLIITRGPDLLSGKTTSCGCIRSIGEEKISLLLTQAGIPFEKEKTFDSCRFETGNLARFDFYVNNRYIIEYDGIQHFKPTFEKLNKQAFDTTQQHDIIKTQWCNKHNIPLIRINYLQLKNLTLEDLLI